jgi:hypothetical protein
MYFNFVKAMNIDNISYNLDNFVYFPVIFYHTKNKKNEVVSVGRNKNIFVRMQKFIKF